MADIDPTANPEAPFGVDENGNPLPDPNLPPSNIPEEVLVDMKNIWSVFDINGEDKVPIIELTTIMRALDIPCSHDYQVKELRELIDPENTGHMTYARLNIVMEEKLKDNDTVEALTEQLKKLDKRGEGQIPAPEFKQYMMNMGSKMTSEELEELMKEADPKGDGAVDIAEFAERMCPPKK